MIYVIHFIGASVLKHMFSFVSETTIPDPCGFTCGGIARSVKQIWPGDDEPNQMEKIKGFRSGDSL